MLFSTHAHELRCHRTVSEYDKKSDFDKLKTPEERREYVEALYEKAHGKSHLSEQSQAIRHALSGRRDKETVLKVMAEVLGVEPVEKDGVCWVGDWQLSFDKNNDLKYRSASSGEPGMLQTDFKLADDT